MSSSLAGKVAVITGGSSGIGRATAELFVEEGAKVVIGDIADGLGREVEIANPEVVRYVHADVTDPEAIKGLVGIATAEFGRLDIMFNNAGAGGDQASIVDSTAESFEGTLRLLLTAAVMGHKYAAETFLRQESGGSIITTSSIAGLQGGHTPVAYAVAKHGLIGLVRQATHELGRFGIRSNAIAPGITMTRAFGIPTMTTEQLTAVHSILSDRLADKQPLGRVAEPLDIAKAALFLASDYSAWISGVVLPVDGGITSVTNSDWPAVTMQTMMQLLSPTQ